MLPSRLRFTTPVDTAVAEFPTIEQSHYHDCPARRHSDPLSAIQVERMRIAAEMRLRKEVRRRDSDIRRLLAHVTVLDSIDASQQTPPTSPPSYEDSSKSFSEESTDCIESLSIHQDSDHSHTPELDNDDDTSSPGESDSDEWDDGEDDSGGEDCVEDILMQLSLLSPMLGREQKEGDIWFMPPKDDWNGPEILSDAADKNVPYEPVVSTTCVEVTEDD